MKTIFSYLLAIALSFGLISCSDFNISDNIKAFPIPDISSINFDNSQNSLRKLSETAPPKFIRQLNTVMARYQPQISILEPKQDKLLKETNVLVKLQVNNFPLFKDYNLGLGPHLNLILDNEPYREIYSAEEPIILENLTPGTHTIRVLAVKPWNESFKTKGSYTTTTFHVLTKTQANNPDPQIPLLTYSSPYGIYGAEPIMLDFYLSNLAPEAIVNNSSTQGLPPWRIKATINGESFILDQWQPVYLEGFKRGNNWLQLELLDQQGHSINNNFNNTVRLITYDPEISNSLAKIVTGTVDFSEAIAIVDPNYELPLAETVTEPADILEEVETIEEVIDQKITPELKPIDKQVINKEVSEIKEKSEVTQGNILQLENIPVKQPNIPENNTNIESQETTKDIREQTIEAITEKIETKPEDIINQKNISEDILEFTQEDLTQEEIEIEEVNVSKNSQIIEEPTATPYLIQEELIKEDHAKSSSENSNQDKIISLASLEIANPITKELNNQEDIIRPEKRQIIESVASKESKQKTDLITIDSKKSQVKVNLDQWVFEHIKQLKDQAWEILQFLLNKISS